MSNPETRNAILREIDLVSDKVTIISGAFRCFSEAYNADLDESNLSDLIWVLSDYVTKTAEELADASKKLEKELALIKDTQNDSTKNNPKYWLVNTADETDGPNGKE